MSIGIKGSPRIVEVCECGIENVLIDQPYAYVEWRVSVECSHKTKTHCEVCENGSLASGGRYIHCTCEICRSL
jgi:hypothetical protein